MKTLISNLFGGRKRDAQHKAALEARLAEAARLRGEGKLQEAAAAYEQALALEPQDAAPLLLQRRRSVRSGGRPSARFTRLQGPSTGLITSSRRAIRVIAIPGRRHAVLHWRTSSTGDRPCPPPC